VEVKFNASGKIQVNGNEIIINIKSEPKRGKANKELIRRRQISFESVKIAYVSFLD